MKITTSNLSRRECHELLMSAVLPRPIALVSTVGEDGVFNLAPYSSYAPVGIKPPLVCLQFTNLRDGRKKDTLRNIEFSKDFVVNVTDENLAEAMNQSSTNYPSHVDEFKEVGLTALKSDLVKSPRLKESPVNMECKLVQILRFGEANTGSTLVIGEVILVHVQDELWTGTEIDINKWKPIARLGGGHGIALYCPVREIFEIKRPNETPDF